MSQLTISAINPFTDTSEDTIAVAQPLRHVAIQATVEDAKFGAVRCEYIYEGFFKHGDTIPVSVSPVDGYTYSRAEITYRVMPYCNRAVGGGFSSGQKTVPAIAVSQIANLYWWKYDVNDTTGLVSLLTSYYVEGGSETTTNDGIIKVIAVCQRQSDNTIVSTPPSQASGPSGTGSVAAPPPPVPEPYVPPDGGTGRGSYTVTDADFQQSLYFSQAYPVDVILGPSANYSPNGSFWFVIVNEGSDDVVVHADGGETLNGFNPATVPPGNGVQFYASGIPGGGWSF